MKTCTKCGEVKPLDEYCRASRNNDGRRSDCKLCTRAAQVEYHSRPEVKLRKAERHRSPETKARKAEYHVENRGQLLESSRRYYAENREQITERTRRYYSENPHVYWESKARSRAEKAGYDITVESFTKADLTARWGNECFHCKGEWTDLDHWPVPISKGGPHTLENCRPACSPCNSKSWRQDV